MKFEISRRARRQIDKVQCWWTGNRPAAHSAFLDDLDKVDRLLRENPELGKIYAEHRKGSVRRILLSQTDYHLYYRYDADRDELFVLAIWGASRRRGPKL